MIQTPITHRDINRFEWYYSRGEALIRAAELKKQGITVYIGGKRARNSYNYHDIKIAAICHNAWNGSNIPWVVAWHD